MYDNHITTSIFLGNQLQFMAVHVMSGYCYIFIDFTLIYISLGKTYLPTLNFNIVKGLISLVLPLLVCQASEVVIPLTENLNIDVAWTMSPHTEISSIAGYFHSPYL